MLTIPSSNSQTPQLGEANGYDLIGDVHGCAQTLERLLQQLGYTKKSGVYKHAHRQAIFLGDIVDRGPRIREALHLVRDMVDCKSAQMILGNHELNAITFCTPVAPGVSEYLRSHTPGNARQIAETLEQFSRYSDEWKSFIDWFVSLPLFWKFSIHVRSKYFVPFMLVGIKR